MNKVKVGRQVVCVCWVTSPETTVFLSVVVVASPIAISAAEAKALNLAFVFGPDGPTIVWEYLCGAYLFALFSTMVTPLYLVQYEKGEKYRELGMIREALLSLSLRSFEPNGYGSLCMYIEKQNTRTCTPEGAHMQKTRNKQNNIYRSMEDIYQHPVDHR